jgi:uncharacterized membrane protein YkoI
LIVCASSIIHNSDNKLRAIIMLKRAVIAIIVLITLSGVMIATFAFSGDNNLSKPAGQQSVSNGTNMNNASNLTNNRVTTTKSRVLVKTNKISVYDLITPAEAKIISKKYVNQTGVTIGTPKLVTEDGKKVYHVPVLDKKTAVGEIDIDARTGKNLGGAGGAPK